MLGSSAVPARATIHTTTSSATPTSPTRPSRLRGLSYLRSYTQNYLHSSPATNQEPFPSPRSPSPSSVDRSSSARPGGKRRPGLETSHIQSGENGWLPTVQGRSGLSRDSLNPTSSTEFAQPEPSGSVDMTRSTAASTLGPMPTITSPRLARVQLPASVGTVAEQNRPEASSRAGPPRDRESLPSVRFIPHVEPRTSRPSLHFATIARTLNSADSVVRVGRYSERDKASPVDASSVSPVGFKSKVVSRRHCEFWCTSGQWYIKDVKSSSGTFLNHVRLSSAGVESRPYPVNDGDVVQLGIDFKGGEEIIFRCVKIRIECNRGWQKSLNNFNTSTHRRLLRNAEGKSKNRDSDAASTSSSECSICLNPVAPCQALFVAPCSHVWHYRCVRNLIHGPQWPNFLCPNCRFVADLDADVEQPEEPEHDYAASHNLPAAASEHFEDASDDGPMGGSSGSPEDEPCHFEVPIRHTTSLGREGRSNDATYGDPFSLSSCSSQPVAIIPVRPPPTSADLLAPHSATPTSLAQFALSAGLMPIGNDQGNRTPRNDAGPFLLDGASGEARGVRTTTEDRAPAAPTERR